MLPSIIDDSTAKKFALYTKDKELISEQMTNGLSIAKKNFSTDEAIKKYNNLFKNIKK